MHGPRGVRPAALTLGRTRVWPGGLDRLGGHPKRGIERLQRTIDPGHEAMDFLECWGNTPEVVAPVRARIAAPDIRRARQ